MTPAAAQDGRVSIEVDPRIAGDTAKTIAEARALWWLVDRPNLFIKIPATLAGLPAITQALSEGISVNVTLIFSLERYGQVIDAYLAGLEQAAAAGHDLSGIASVASFFVSRVDTEVDRRLDKIGSEQAQALRGQAAIANARLAYELFEQKFDENAPRWPALHRPGPGCSGRCGPRPAPRTRPTRTPCTSPTSSRRTRSTRCRRPTIHATADHAVLRGDTIHGTYDQSRQVFADLEQLGISYDDVVDVLEREGVREIRRVLGRAAGDGAGTS